MGPKAVARVLRFERALRLLRDGRALADVAYDCGYADQPHLNREFRALARQHTAARSQTSKTRRRRRSSLRRMPSYPALRYRDAPAAIAWLESFGFETTERIDNPDGTIAHAELRLGDALIMLGSGGRRPRGPAARQPARRALVDLHRHAGRRGHPRRARAAGADVSDLFEQDYGSRDFSARDPKAATTGRSGRTCPESS